MIRIKGFYFGKNFDITVKEECYMKILNTEGVAIWFEEYLQ